jgi:hypothetical protein
VGLGLHAADHGTENGGAGHTARAKALILALNWFWAVMVRSFQVGCAGGALHV